MARLYLLLGSLALSLFGWTQYQGAGLFDDVASNTPARSASGSRPTFHK